jgi:hypothetical protein
LRARAEDDGGADELRARWELVSGPAGSAVPRSTSLAQPTVTFDLPGTYTYRFVATDAQGLTATSDVTYVVG